MTTTIKRQAYGKLRAIIKRRGGKMEYVRQGYRHGAWEISLDGGRVCIKAEGRMAFPALDKLYVPKPDVSHPNTWDDYTDMLVADAEEQLCALLIVGKTWPHKVE